MNILAIAEGVVLVCLDVVEFVYRVVGCRRGNNHDEQLPEACGDDKDDLNDVDGLCGCREVEEFVELGPPAVGLPASNIARHFEEHPSLLLPEAEDVVAEKGRDNVEYGKAEEGKRPRALYSGKDRVGGEKGGTLDSAAGHFVAFCLGTISIYM